MLRINFMLAVLVNYRNIFCYQVVIWGSTILDLSKYGLASLGRNVAAQTCYGSIPCLLWFVNNKNKVEGISHSIILSFSL